MAKELDCKLEVSEFELQLHNYTHFLTNTLGEKYEPPNSLFSYGLNSITAVLLQG